MYETNPELRNIFCILAGLKPTKRNCNEYEETDLCRIRAGRAGRRIARGPTRRRQQSRNLLPRSRGSGVHAAGRQPAGRLRKPVAAGLYGRRDRRSGRCPPRAGARYRGPEDRLRHEGLHDDQVPGRGARRRAAHLRAARLTACGADGRDGLLQHAAETHRAGGFGVVRRAVPRDALRPGAGQFGAVQGHARRGRPLARTHGQQYRGDAHRQGPLHARLRLGRTGRCGRAGDDVGRGQCHGVVARRAPGDRPPGGTNLDGRRSDLQGQPLPSCAPTRSLWAAASPTR